VVEEEAPAVQLLENFGEFGADRIMVECDIPRQGIGEQPVVPAQVLFRGADVPERAVDPGFMPPGAQDRLELEREVTDRVTAPEAGK